MFFSLVLPTWNRAFCIRKAIDSVLAQTFRDWELVIADDGSTDGTEDLVREAYATELADGRFTYLQLPHGDVCRARNAALGAAKGEWIAYVDSDNVMRPDHLQAFADAIAAHPATRTFYAKLKLKGSGEEKGRPFDWNVLLERNFIDLGVFVHHRDLVASCGGFDEGFQRLVDWELILRYTAKSPPVFVDRVLLDYNDTHAFARITGSWNGNQDWKAAVIAKHGAHLPMVTTLITTYNHKNYIAEAIESAMRQEGPFRREIIVSDDGSTDGTAELVADYARRYPHLVRNISLPENRGVSANVRNALLAVRGEFVATLEGDDYWVDDRKLAKQMAFLGRHAECPMVFSRLFIRKDTRPALHRLAIQENLPELMTGRDFFNAGSSSVIVNFSCCLFRRASFTDIPPCLWEPRLSEIAFAFHLERKGPIGFMSEPMSVYRIHDGGVWQGASFVGRRLQEIDCRKLAIRVCDPRYVDDFKNEIFRINEICRAQLSVVRSDRILVSALTALLPYGLVVHWWRRYRSIEIDRPLLAYPGWSKRLRRLVKFALPYGAVMAFRRHVRKNRKWRFAD